MGANCSHDSYERYETLKKHIESFECLNLHAIDGLISHKSGNPVILMGEHHNTNEGLNMTNCLNVIEVVQTVVSNCLENKSSILFMYENPVISDNILFEKEDPNLPFYDGQEEMNNIDGTRYNINISDEYNNINTLPIEIFGRMRLFNINGGIRNSIHTQNVAINEVKEFWKKVGYPDKYIEVISPQALELAKDLTDVFFSNISETSLSRTEILEVFTCTSLAKLSLSVNENTPGDTVIKHCDILIGVLMSQEPENQEHSINIDIVGDIETRRETIRMLLLFELIAISGDIIVYEYINFLKKQKDIIILIHAGFNHTNRIRNWLLVSEYKSDLERVTDMASEDIHFNESRVPFSI